MGNSALLLFFLDTAELKFCFCEMFPRVVVGKSCTAKNVLDPF